MSWFDSHCHFDFPVFDHDRELIWQHCQQLGISGLLIPGISRSQGVALEARCLNRPWCYALGLHPFFDHESTDLDWLQQALANASHRCVAVGETGLDWRKAEDKPQRQNQIVLLDAHIELASRYGLPLILHAVGAHDEAAARIKRAGFSGGGVIHAFSGSLPQARRYLDLGFRLGAGGLLSQPRARKLHEAVQQLPPSAWLLETDAPDMTPRFWAEARNTPASLPLLGQILARLWKLSLTDVQVLLLDNLRSTFPRLAQQAEFQPSKE
ncbi:TatD family hydrolase [Parathalassolituus penaei]|uniref:TatD family hydrolase n=1 Tax=Parathalassolituus penaei TaxID=2997323 RepID=A0A9X3IUA7_9GAMM|nr:TatD family hydrolase [Parathalassolituus penaei]MCY0967175.1 TatD family hydrolase [Parathalassolituus penaei]